MRQLLLIIFAVLFTGPLAAFAQDVTSETAGEIRYRSIIYFYSDAKLPSQAYLNEHLKDFTRVEALPENLTRPVVNFSILDDFDETYPVPDQEYLRYFGRGLSKVQVDAIQTSSHLLRVDIGYPQALFLSGYEPVMAFLHQTAQQHDGLIWDSETRELFTPEAWAQKRLSPNEGGYPNVSDHITIHAYNNENDEGVRAITLGMIKFGLPDIVVNDFSWTMSDPIGNLINLTSQSILEGLKPDGTGVFKLDINKIKNPVVREHMKQNLLDKAVSKLEIEWGAAEWENGDPDNALVELLFNKFEGKTISEKQELAVSTLFGWEDTLAYIQHDDEIRDASLRAKGKLNGLREDFNNGLEPGEFILLKAPFKTRDDGNEWMWVEVMSWNETSIKGLLKNEPYYVPDLRAGSEVEINQDDVFDYIRNYADGRSEGNETGEIISKQR